VRNLSLVCSDSSAATLLDTVVRLIMHGRLDFGEEDQSVLHLNDPGDDNVDRGPCAWGRGYFGSKV